MCPWFEPANSGKKFFMRGYESEKLLVWRRRSRRRKKSISRAKKGWGGYTNKWLIGSRGNNPSKKPSLVPFFPSSLPFPSLLPSSVTFFTSYCTVLYCTVLYCTVLCTLLSSSISKSLLVSRVSRAEPRMHRDMLFSLLRRCRDSLDFFAQSRHAKSSSHLDTALCCNTDDEGLREWEGGSFSQSLRCSGSLLKTY